MQAAVDIVGTSPHPTNKIACTLAGIDQNSAPYALSRTNFFPEVLVKHFGLGTRIGSASGSVHAEMACILSASKTKHASAFVTDPPCPNCMKYMAEAGIEALYIDHKGFDKDFAKRRGDDFENMSLRICERAGIKVFRLWRKEQRLETILDIPDDYAPPLEDPALCIEIEHANEATFRKAIETSAHKFQDEPFALCLAQDTIDGKFYALSANIHAVIGYTHEDQELKEGKYSFLLQPLNRLLVNAARKGLKIQADSVYSNRVPTARELVNFIGGGYDALYIGDKQKSRDEHGIEALKMLEDASLLKVQRPSRNY